MSYSCLFPEQAKIQEAHELEEPEYFKDLDLDEVFLPLLKRYPSLKNLYYSPIQDVETIYYRQAILRDLQRPDLYQDFTQFAEQISRLKEPRLEANNLLSQGHFLATAQRYCKLLLDLQAELSVNPPISKGLKDFAAYLEAYCAAPKFREFFRQANELRQNFSSVRYNMLIKRDTISVKRYEGELDLSEKITGCFEQFRPDRTRVYRKKLKEAPYALHVEEAVLQGVVKLYPEVFAPLWKFCRDFQNFMDKTLLQFAQEIIFYLAWLDEIRPLQRAGLNFCYPKMKPTITKLSSYASFDLALAQKLQGKVVTNDFCLQAPERIMMITGPNQGGKTTFARTFGQLHYLASLGLSVPGRSAELFCFDRIYTHFERQEHLTTQNGKLQDDLVRLHEILQSATNRSIIIINEIFSSTTLDDALLLGEKMLKSIKNLQIPTVLVTFLEELGKGSPEIVHLMSNVDSANPLHRSFKIRPCQSNGRAFAGEIAWQYHLAYQQLKERLNNESESHIRE